MAAAGRRRIPRLALRREPGLRRIAGLLLRRELLRGLAAAAARTAAWAAAGAARSPAAAAGRRAAARTRARDPRAPGGLVVDVAAVGTDQVRQTTGEALADRAEAPDALAVQVADDDRPLGAEVGAGEAVAHDLLAARDDAQVAGLQLAGGARRLDRGAEGQLGDLLRHGVSVARNESVSPDCGPSFWIEPSGDFGWLKKMKKLSSASLSSASSPKHEMSHVIPGAFNWMPTYRSSPVVKDEIGLFCPRVNV